MDALGAEVLGIRGSFDEPEEFGDDGAGEDAFCGEEGEDVDVRCWVIGAGIGLAECEAESGRVEEGEGAGAGAVGTVFALGED